MGTTPSTPSSAELPQGGSGPSESQANETTASKENRNLEAREAKLGETIDCLEPEQLPRRGQDPAETQGTATTNEETFVDTIMSVSPSSSVASLNTLETKKSPHIHHFEEALPLHVCYLKSQIETVDTEGANGSPVLIPPRMEKNSWSSSMRPLTKRYGCARFQNSSRQHSEIIFLTKSLDIAT